MTENKKTTPEHIYSIDVLRGIAALCVVFWHWQHFFYIDGKLSQDFIISNQPFYDLLYPLYNHGYLAVQLFFAISGFIFFWLYSSKIAEGKISICEFSIDRFSRLYPLHFLTFFITLLLQKLYFRENEFYFVYPENDMYHAILNILLISAWGFQHGWSFNAPIWSVSIEVLLYIIFFIVCTININKVLVSALLVAFSFYLLPFNSNISEGVMTFFCGGLAFFVLNSATKIFNQITLIMISLLSLIASWYLPVYFHGNEISLISCISFPITILFLAIVSYTKNNFLKPLRFIGNLSYSSYLIHFPLQVIFIMASKYLGYTNDIYYSPWILLLFVLILILLSNLSYNYFEIPMQRYIRGGVRKKIQR